MQQVTGFAPSLTSFVLLGAGRQGSPRLWGRMRVVLAAVPSSAKDESEDGVRELRRTDKDPGEWALGLKMLNSRTKRKTKP